MRILKSIVPTFKRPIGVYFALLAILFVATLLLFSSIPKRKVVAQERKKINWREKAPKPTRTSQSIHAPITAMEQSSGSELALNNNGPTSIIVNPVFYDSQGQAYPAQPLTLEATKVRHLEIDSIKPAEFRGSNGGLTLNYNGAMMEVVAQITSFGQGQAGSVDIPFSAAMDYKSSIQEAVWWSPEQSTATIILGNASDAAITAKLQFSNGEAATSYLAPYATEIVEQRRNKNQAADSVKITATGAVGALRVTGAIQTTNNRYTSTIRFYDPQTVRQQNLYATNFRLKGNVPHLVLNNISAEPLTVTPRFLSAAGASGNPVELAPVKLAPNQATEVNLNQLVAAAASRQDLETVTVEILSSGAKGSLIGALSAHNEATRMTYDAPLRDSGPIRNSTGGYPWQITGAYSAIVSITNVGEAPAKFLASVNFAEGAWQPPIKQLAAGETAFFDIRKIRDQQIKDKDGRVVPKNITSGQFHWSRFQGDENLHLIGRLEMRSTVGTISSIATEANHDTLRGRRRVTRNVSSSFSCGVCCPDSGPYPYLTPDTFALAVNNLRTVDSKGDIYACYGGNPFTTYVVTHAWNSAAPAVISLAQNQGAENTVTGVSGGTTYHYGIAETFHIWEEGAGDCYRNTELNPEVSGDTTVFDVTISAAVNCNDGDTASFSVTGTPFEFVTGYAWSYTPFSLQGGIGNNPQVNFGSPSSDSTTANCKWFASPDQECTLDVCKYKISCTITFNNGTNITKETNLFVEVPWSPAGLTYPPSITGFPAMQFSFPAGRYVVANQGDWTRNLPTPDIRVPASSQFYNKTVIHENKHVAGYGPGGTNADLYLISDLYSRVSGLTDGTEDGLRNKIIGAWLTWTIQQDTKTAMRSRQDEIQAYQVSDSVDPRYLYQGRCNGF